MISRVGYFIAVLWLAATNANAGSLPAPSDVAVGLTAQPRSSLVTGQSVYFTLSVTNHGPEPVDDLVLLSTAFVDEFDGYDVSTNCQNLVVSVADGEFYFYNYIWYVTLQRTLDVGENRSCSLRLVVTSHMPSVFQFGFSALDPDINPDNDSAIVTLRRAPAPVATPVPALSRAMSCLLAVLLGAIGSVGWRGSVRR
jgi:hypothetical protein